MFLLDDKIGALADRRERIAAINHDFFDRLSTRWVTRESAAFQNEFGYDPLPVIKQPGFSIAGVGRQLREKYKLTEAITTSQLFSLTKITTIAGMTDAYKLAVTSYRNLAQVTTSKSAEETYFPLQRGDIPVPVGETEAAPESRLGGVMTRIKNYKFARVLVYSEDLAADDQTGQLATQAGQIGEAMSYAEEQWWIVTLFATYQVANLRSAGGIVPSMNIAGSGGTTYGGPVCTAGPLTQPNLENLYGASGYVTDIEGNFALVMPDTLLVAWADRLTAKKLLNSMYNPATPPAGNQATGGIFSENPMKGELTISASPFLMRARAGIDGANRPWALLQSGRGHVFQERTPLTVVTEAPNAGKSFDEDSVRTKVKRRFGAGTVLPEFIMVGN
jgi:hypothetical protein